MNMNKLKDAGKNAKDAMFEDKEGNKKDTSVIKKILKTGGKILIGIALLGIGFLFGDKGIEFVNRLTGNAPVQNDCTGTVNSEINANNEQ